MTQRKVSLIVYDFDGVLTDNRVLVTEEGKEAVSCNRSDGWWISKIKEMGIPQIILSTEKNSVVSARGMKLGLEVIQGKANKLEALRAFASVSNVRFEEICYVGNEVNDLDCMRTVGISFAPQDSHPEVLKIAHHKIPANGGAGLVRYLYEWLSMADGSSSAVNFRMPTRDASSSSSRETIVSLIKNSIETKTKILESDAMLSLIETMAGAVVKALRTENKIFFAGNGGSFSDSIHLAAEFVSRLNFDRAPLASIALGANQSNLTAIGNDYGYEHVFEREILALARPGDVFFAISTSGNSPSILSAVKAALTKGVQVFGWSGESGGKLAELCLTLKVPARNTARIQESHIMIGHSICEIAENEIFGSLKKG